MKKIISFVLCMVMLASFASSAFAIKVIPIKGIKLDKSSLNLTVGKTYILKVTFTPANTTQKRIVFSTNNKNVAIIDAKGKITAVKAGKAVITVSSASNKKINAKCNVTVVSKVLEPLKISIAMSHENASYLSSSPDINKDKYIKKIDELANVKLDIQLLDHNKLQEQYNLLYASGDIPDVVVQSSPLSSVICLNAVKEGIFLNLKPYINEKTTPDLLKKIPAIYWDFADLNKDGGIYFIPSYSSVVASTVTYVRADLLEKFGLSAPDTLDEYLNVLRVFKKNGVKYPYSGREGFAFSTSFFGAFGAIPGSIVMDANGNIMPVSILPEMKEALRFHRQLYQEGLIDQEVLSNTGVVWDGKVVSGDVGVFTHMLRNYSSWDSRIKANVPDAKLTILPGPKGPEGYRVGGSATVGKACLVNKKVKEPERIVKFLNWMATDEAETLFQFGIEGDTYTKKDGKIQFTYPTEQNAANELLGRSVVLDMVGDNSIKRLITPYAPGGEKIIQYADKYGKIKGRQIITILGPALDIYSTSPELNCNGDKTSLWLEMASKIIYGKEPVDYFDQWVKDWKARGGDKVLQQLEEKKKAGLYIKS